MSSSSDLIRWGGLAALVGGVLFVVGDLLGLTLGADFAQAAASGTFVLQQLVFLLGTVLVLFGLFGLYVSQSEAAGILGLFGFLVALLGMALLSGFSWAQAFVVPLIATQSPALLETEPLGSILSFVTFTVGWLVFGIATLRAGVYPRAAAIGHSTHRRRGAAHCWFHPSSFRFCLWYRRGVVRFRSVYRRGLTGRALDATC